MQLSLDPSALALIAACRNDALLGIILLDGQVLIRKGDRVICPGHAAWVRRDVIRNAFRGFSLAVRDGQVLGLVTASVLNPEPGCQLESEVAAQLESLLPLDREYRRLEE